MNMKALAHDIGVLAEDKKLFMKFDNGQIDTTAEVEYDEGKREQNTKHHTSDAEMAQLAATTKKIKICGREKYDKTG
eukprot:15589920-Heterocapsa_arctica.AAC.1